MRRIIGKFAVALAAFAWFGSAPAHHSMSMFDVQKSIWLQGTVIDYQPVNPHALVTLEQKIEGGPTRRWLVEGPNLNRLHRMGVGSDFLKPGDVIEICGFPFKQQLAPSSTLDPGRPPRPAMHAHMVVMPDGHMRLFGPYGKLDNCIRQHDTTQSWVQFLNTDPLARQAWCNSQTYVSIPSTAPPGFVNEINKLMANPCD